MDLPWTLPQSFSPTLTSEFASIPAYWTHGAVSTVVNSDGWVPGSQRHASAIAFLDASIEDYQTIAAAIAPGTAIYRLNPLDDAIQQITQTLLQHEQVSSVHIFSHGSAGQLQLGQTVVDANFSDRDRASLQQWATVLTDDADVLLYGCEVGAGAIGAQFLAQLAHWTGADIAASTNLTGNANAGGDWELEVNTGAIAANGIVRTQWLTGYQSILSSTLISSNGSFPGNNNSWTGGADGFTWNFDAVTTSRQSMSDDGRYLLYTTQASNLTGSDFNGAEDIYLYDRTTNTRILVSARYEAASDDNFSTITGNGRSFNPVMSADGRYVAFSSAASNLVANDGNGGIVDVFLWDRVTRQTTLISRSNTGDFSQGDSLRPSISRDGKRVAFSNAGNLLRNGDFFNQVFVYEWTTASTSGSIRQVSVNNAGQTGNDQTAFDFPALISGDGRYVVFESRATNFVDLNGDNIPEPDANGIATDVFVRDLETNRTLLVSVNIGNTSTGNNDAYRPVISDDGRYIAFISNATNLNGTGSNGGRHAYVRDMVSGITQLISLGPNGEQTQPWQATPYVALSGDGRTAVFTNASDNLVPNDTNGGFDVFVRDLNTNTTELVSVNQTNTGPGNQPSDPQERMLPSLSHDGRYIVFSSLASDLVAGDTNGTRDVFVRDRIADTTTLVSRNFDGSGSGNGASDFGIINRNGNLIAYTSIASDLTAAGFDNNSSLDVFLTLNGNQPPIAVNDTFGTNEDTLLSGNVLTNDTDIENNRPFAATLINGPSHGSLSFNSNGTFTYTPTAEYSGTDTFTYSIRDSQGAESGLASVVLSVTATNDAPIAVNDAFGVQEDSILNGNVLTNDTDQENNVPLTATLVSGPSNGSLVLNSNGTFEYTPTLNYTGTDTFTYSARDSLGGTSTPATVVLSITATNDAPIAVNDTYTLPTGTTSTIPAFGVLSNDTDVDTPVANLTASLLNAPSHGSLTFNANGSFVYTPTGTFVGTDSFTYRVNDGLVNSNLAIVLLSVTLTPNVPPIAVNDTASGLEDSLITGNVLTNDSDPNNNLPLAATLVGAPLSGSVSLNANGNFSYTPGLNFNGSDRFTYITRDALGDPSNTATVSITVNPVNDAPSFTPGANQSALAGSGAQTVTNWATGFVPGPTNEAGQAIVGYEIVSNSNPGIFTATPTINPAGTLTYTPINTVTGDVSAVIGVRVQDNGGVANGGVDRSTTQFFTITVTNRPVATISSVSQVEGNSGDTPFLFTVSLSGASANTINMSYSTSDGSATVANGDYVATTGTLTFLPGETVKTVTVNVRGDTNFEANETFSVNLSAPVNVILGNSSTTGTIQNDDTAPTINVLAASRVEGQAGLGQMLFTVTLSGSSFQTITVNYQTDDGTATRADGDYFGTIGTLTFLPGETSKAIAVNVGGDSRIEPDETFTLTLRNPVNGTLGVSRAIGTILNDDNVTTSDFNQDGINDIVWRNYTTGENMIWIMGSTLPSTTLALPTVDLNWWMAGVADFNRDNKPDLLWRNYYTGETGFWLMDGGSISSVVVLEPYVPVNWIIEDVGDLDGDGQADILWRNSQDGYTGVWYMNGTSLRASEFLSYVPMEWTVEGIADVNNDGRQDVVWRHQPTSYTGAWLMRGTAGLQFFDTTNLPAPIGSNWDLAATGDFNNDGKTDYVWRNHSTGDNLIWLMNGTQLIAQASSRRLLGGYWLGGQG